MYREFVKPYQKRAVDWAHSHGMYAELHSCGYVEPLIPDFIEIGVDCLNPLEVKAGMDPVKIKRQYGNKITLRGGFNAAYLNDAARTCANIRALLPTLMEGGGYIFSSDHSIPSSVSLETLREVAELVREIGRYGKVKNEK
jgi:uroporphyrinogen decarboxylase